MGRVGRLMWEIHDFLSETMPKAGESFAFRRMSIPLREDVEDDDTFIGVYVAEHGGRSLYAPRAIVYNRSPSNFAQLLQQRYRVNRQIFGLLKRTGIATSTWDPARMAASTVRYFRRHWRKAPEFLVLSLVEALARTSALASWFVDASPLKSWRPIDATKLPIDIPAPETPPHRAG